jgi:hypothetical protein
MLVRMGFSAPKPDPQIVAAQKAQANLARVDRISLIQQQLDNEDQLRARVYGTRGTSLFQQALGGTGGTAVQQGLASLFSAMFRGPAPGQTLTLGGPLSTTGMR